MINLHDKKIFFAKGSDIYLDSTSVDYENVVSLYKKYGYSESGYCWESFIRYVLENEYPEGLDYIDFNSESDMFTAEIDDKNQRKIILKKLNTIFSSQSIETYIKNADRQKIDD